jgi:hypothetical protein
MFLKPSTPIRPSVGIFFLLSVAYAGLLFKEPIDPTKKEDPEFIYESYFEQWSKKLRFVWSMSSPQNNQFPH